MRGWGASPSPSPFHPRSQDPSPGKGCVAGEEIGKGQPGRSGMTLSGGTYNRTGHPALSPLGWRAE